MSSRSLPVGFVAPPRTLATNADHVASAKELRRHVCSRDLDRVMAWCKEEGGRVGINDRDKKGKSELFSSVCLVSLNSVCLTNVVIAFCQLCSMYLQSMETTTSSPSCCSSPAS